MTVKASCGIDFGTSNSTCAIADGKGARLVPLEGDSTTLPSAIFFCVKGDTLFGREAIKAYVEREEGRLMRGLKSILGTSLMQERTIVNSRARSFVDILSLYISHLKSKAEEFAGQKIDDVIMGRPVHFHDNDPAADQASQSMLEDIARSVGFRNVQFQYEPIAAGFSHERDVQGEKLSFVIDLGGGTSDFTVIRLSEQRRDAVERGSDVLSATGIRVGGTNFDRALSMASFMPFLGYGSHYRGQFDQGKILTAPASVYSHLSDWAKVYQAHTARAVQETRDILRTAEEPEKIRRLLQIQEQQSGYTILHAVERTKIALTYKLKVNATFPDMDETFDFAVTRVEFENSIHSYISRIQSSFDDSLKQAGIARDQIELVILTGGSTELPSINMLVEQYFPAARISRGHKFDSVGLGLAYQAQRSYGAGLF